MTKKPDPLPPLDWRPITDWPIAHLEGFNDLTGLLRFKQNSEIVYIGMETISLANFRRFATPGGSAQRHAGGREIYARRFETTLEYAVLNDTPDEIKRVRNALWVEHQPRYNFEDLDTES